MSLKTRDSDYVALTDNSDENDSYISLFPYLDRFIMYTPTYVLKNRDHGIHRVIIILIAFGVFSMMVLQLWIFSSASINGLNPQTSGFVILMFILPFFASALRLYFFMYHFDYKIWHRPKQSISNPSKYASSLSFILKQEPFFLARMCKRFKIGSCIIFIILFIIIILRLLINIQYAVPEMFHHRKEKSKIIKMHDNMNNYIFILVFVLMLIYVIGQQIPDCLMMIVGRLYFTECHLAIFNYTKDLKTMNSKQIIMGNIHTKYIEMYQFIDKMAKPFKNFILCFIISYCCLCWYLLTQFSSMAARVYNNEEISILNECLLSVYAIHSAILGIFTLWPAFRMTELNDELINVVDQKITNILENRIHFYDDDILNPLMDSLQKNNNNNTLSLRSNISRWSEEKSALEILTKLVSTMEQHSCQYQVFGLSLDRYSIRNFIIGLIVGKIFALMWSSV